MLAWNVDDRNQKSNLEGPDGTTKLKNVNTTTPNESRKRTRSKEGQNFDDYPGFQLMYTYGDNLFPFIFSKYINP